MCDELCVNYFSLKINGNIEKVISTMLTTADNAYLTNMQTIKEVKNVLFLELKNTVFTINIDECFLMDRKVGLN